MLKFAIYFILIFAGFNGVFRYGNWLPIYQYGVIVTAFFLFKEIKKLEIQDFYLGACLIILIFSSFLNWNDKSYNYILAYIYTFIFLYKNIDRLCRNINLNKLLKFNAIGILISAFFSCIEFFFNFFLKYKISDLLPRYKDATAIYDEGINRSYGFATEPTTLALYFNILGPFALLYWFKNKGKAKSYFYSIILLMGFCFTFSAAGFLFLTISTLFVLVVTYRFSILKLITRNLTKIVIFLSTLLFFIKNGFLDKIFGKIILNGEGKSSTQRLEVFELAIQRFIENPIIGYGLGYTSSIGEMSPINWYLVLATNGGIFALLLILAFNFSYFKTSLKIRKKYGVLPAIGIICGFLGFLTTSTFYNPFFWIGIIFINKMQHSYDYNFRGIQ